MRRMSASEFPVFCCLMNRVTRWIGLRFDNFDFYFNYFMFQKLVFLFLFSLFFRVFCSRRYFFCFSIFSLDFFMFQKIVFYLFYSFSVSGSKDYFFLFFLRFSLRVFMIRYSFLQPKITSILTFPNDFGRFNFSFVLLLFFLLISEFPVFTFNFLD